MPSYFFHIALDLSQTSPSSNLHRGFKPFLSSFRQTIKKSVNPPRKRIHNSHAPSNDQPPQQDTKQDTKQEKFSVTTVAVKNSGKGNDPQPDRSHPKAVEGSNLSPGAHDWRYDKIFVHGIEMARSDNRVDKHKGNDTLANHLSNGLAVGPVGLATKGRYEPIEAAEEELGWGIVRVYREAEETPGLYDDVATKAMKSAKEKELLPFRDEDCTTLCILAVPSYLTPSDFLGFVGEKTREEVSHFRMIRTERGNRYMVLMKFRNGKKAREWRKVWNGKTFDGMEPENCHVVFIKSIELRTRQNDGQEPSFPDMANDPFTPSPPRGEKSGSGSTVAQSSSLSATSLSSKPVAPPTPDLFELPTCPVCLERMDESTGLLTILCQHVFHCSCLQKWRGSGCPVCRYTQDDLGKRFQAKGEEPGLNECSTCRSDANLWVCLICGNVGCGRYDAAHAFAHYEQTSHCFAMDLNTQRVWDYASDGYVHRIMQSKTDGKLVQLPSTPANTIRTSEDDFDDYVPREKLENIGLEYTHLLTSQLDSQRMYFEEILERAADKTFEATRAAEEAIEADKAATQKGAALQAAHDNLMREIIPALERDRERAVRRAEKFESMARKMEKEWREEKAMSGSLLENVKRLSDEVERLKGEKIELEEQNRDLGFFISGGEKLRGGLKDKSVVGVSEEELLEGTLSLPEARPSQGQGGRKKSRR